MNVTPRLSNHCVAITAAAIAACALLAPAAADAGSASEYVQDGLLACWDGFENAGANTHDASATVWKDLVAGREFNLYNVTVADDGMVFGGTQSSYGELDAANTAATFGSAANGMLEIVYASSDGASSYTVLQSSADSGIALGMYESRFIAGSGDAANAPMFAYAAGLSTNSVAIRYSSARPVGAWVWGDALGTAASDFWGAAEGKTTIGTRTSKQNNPFKGTIYCIRVYSRQLTALEIAANSVVDRRRYIERSGVNLDGISLNGFFRGAAIVVNNLSDNVRLTNFPVLVRISSENFSGFSYGDMFASATGRDIAFTDAQGRGLAYDIDTWNTNGTSLAWVTVPVLTNGTKIAMFYRSGNDGKSVCPGNAFSDYVGVWHMNEAADGVTTIYDSTTNDLYGTSVASSLSKSDGIVGRARYITANETISANSKPVAPYDSGVTVDMTEDAAKLALVDSIIPEFFSVVLDSPAALRAAVLVSHLAPGVRQGNRLGHPVDEHIRSVPPLRRLGRRPALHHTEHHGRFRERNMDEGGRCLERQDPALLRQRNPFKNRHPQAVPHGDTAQQARPRRFSGAAVVVGLLGSRREGRHGRNPPPRGLALRRMDSRLLRAGSR